ncbi:Hypothetical_protein [Hexamita inflata]|uniref:Hypothetical_protein n=1 Tax=Hexamita inflata TaxID=28002 RepID=A0AA86PX87_9EUKA|nr:Hypothetical protein HINF_LOCUS29754 [Hexamita inflata]
MQESISDDVLFTSIAKMLDIQQSDRSIQNIVVAILKLPDEIYKNVFIMLSYKLNINSVVLHRQFSDILQKYLDNKFTSGQQITNIRSLDQTYNFQPPQLVPVEQSNFAQIFGDSSCQKSDSASALSKLNQSKYQNVFQEDNNKQSWEDLVQQIAEIQPNIFSNPQSDPPRTKINQNQNELEKQGRTQTKQHQEFQELFSTSAKRLLQNFTDVSQITDKQLCGEIARYLNEFASVDFWGMLSKLVQSRTAVQLREYYKKSFSRLMFTECLAQNDKVVLKQLVASMPHSKPSEIATKFMDMFQERNYFKRNVIMYIVNMKNFVNAKQK